MTRADTIARHLSAFETHLLTVARGVDVATRTSAVPDAVAALREAFAALDGGAAVAGEANGPPEPAPPDEEPSAEVLAADDSPDEPSGLWVVKTPTGWFRGAGLSDARVLARARRFPQRRDAVACAIDTVGVVLTLAEADRGGELKPPTPEPPKPAGWVVRLSGNRDAPYFGENGFRATVEEAGPFTHRDDAIMTRFARLSAFAAKESEILPVDAGGNVIEALPGVAWEAARAGEEAERLRGELAAVKAERDKVLSNAAVLDTSLRRLRTDHATTLAERDALAAEVQRSREQKPVHLALVDKQGAVVDGYLIKTRALAEDDARRRACTVAPLYLAPVVRDVSGVIAQCEEALNGDVAVRHALRAALVSALAALKGDAK